MEKIASVSAACLLGRNVRYDGGHQPDRFLRDTLGHFVEYVPVCPEVEMGLPIPRDTLRLVGEPDALCLVFHRAPDRTGEGRSERLHLQEPFAELFDRYQRLLMKVVRLPATSAKHVNVLQHALGYFKRQLSPDEKQELLEIIEQYRQKQSPVGGTETGICRVRQKDVRVGGLPR